MSICVVLARLSERNRDPPSRGDFFGLAGGSCRNYRRMGHRTNSTRYLAATVLADVLLLGAALGREGGE